MSATARIISLEELEAGNAAVPLQASGALQALLHVRTRLQACVGSAEMSVAELLDAQVDQVLPLDTALDQPIDLLVEGRVVARGQLVAVGDCFGVRITEAPQGDPA